MATTKTIWKLAAMFALALAAPAATAKTYRCESVGGPVILQDRPCTVIREPAAPLPEPPCPLSAEQRRRAEREEGQFLVRFPDEASHRVAEHADLGLVAVRIRLARVRYDELGAERKKIDDDIEFYKGKPLPVELKQRHEANEAKFAALADVFRGEAEDIRRVAARYACERERLGLRWRRGASPGISGCVAPCRGPVSAS